MGIIKVNYNNIYILKPGNVAPQVFAYRKNNLIHIIVNGKLDENSYYKDFYFEVYANDILIKTIDSNSDNEAVVDNPDLYNEISVTIKVVGYYTDDYNKYYFNDIILSCYIMPICDEYIYCDNDVIVNDLREGYLDNNRFYLTKLNDNIYTDEVLERDGAYYYDLISEYVYVYNDSTEEFEKI